MHTVSRRDIQSFQHGGVFSVPRVIMEGFTFPRAESMLGSVEGGRETGGATAKGNRNRLLWSPCQDSMFVTELGRLVCV